MLIGKETPGGYEEGNSGLVIRVGPKLAKVIVVSVVIELTT